MTSPPSPSSATGLGSVRSLIQAKTAQSFQVLIIVPSTDFDPTETSVPFSILKQKKNVQITFATPDGKPGCADQKVVTGKGFGLLKSVLGATPPVVKLYKKMIESPEFKHPLRWDQLVWNSLDKSALEFNSGENKTENINPGENPGENKTEIITENAENINPGENRAESTIKNNLKQNTCSSIKNINPGENRAESTIKNNLKQNTCSSIKNINPGENRAESTIENNLKQNTCSSIKNIKNIKTTSTTQIQIMKFDGVILPGGHAKGMIPYLESSILQLFVSQHFQLGRKLAAVCHGVVLAARCKRKDGKSILYEKKVTALLKTQELTAHSATWLWLGDYYRTYPGETVQGEITKLLKSPQQFLTGPMPLYRDDLDHLSYGYTVCDGNLLTARWPGDCHNFGLEFYKLLEK